MKIKLKHEFGNLTLTTEHDDPDKNVRPQITIQTAYPGLEASIKGNLEREIEFAHGHYGHLVNLYSTSNLDLAAAVKQLKSFKVVSIEPQIKPNSLPPGAIT